MHSLKQWCTKWICPWWIILALLQNYIISNCKWIWSVKKFLQNLYDENTRNNQTHFRDEHHEKSYLHSKHFVDIQFYDEFFIKEKASEYEKLINTSQLRSKLHLKSLDYYNLAHSWTKSVIYKYFLVLTLITFPTQELSSLLVFVISWLVRVRMSEGWNIEKVGFVSSDYYYGTIILNYIMFRYDYSFD